MMKTGGRDRWYEKHYKSLEQLQYYCDNKEVYSNANHEVLIVGWDDDMQVEGAPGKGAYLVKDDTTFSISYYKDYNSYYAYSRNCDAYENGIYWKVNNKVNIKTNYYYVSYYDYYIESAAYGVENVSIGAYPKAPYQYDKYGISSTIDISKSNAYGANVFARKTGNTLVPEKLNAIGIANLVDASYEIYVNPKSGDLSSDDFIKIAETDVLKAGYHTIDVSDEDITLIGNKFAIAVRYKSLDNSEYAQLGVQAPKVKTYTFENGNLKEIQKDIPYYSGVTSSSGHSFIGSTLDNLQDMYTYNNGETKDMSLCIKAFTEDYAGFTIMPENIDVKYKTSSGAYANVPQTMKVTKGDKISFKAEITPLTTEYKDVSWETSNARIATIDEKGFLTAVGPGKVTIIARVKNVTYVYKTWEIDVRVPVTSFKLNFNRVSLQDGVTTILAPIIGPDDATISKIEWTSSDKNVVMVTENGLLIALNRGNATVTALLRDMDGNIIKDSNGNVFSAYCNVEVPYSAITEVTGISLNKATITLLEENSETLKATVLPATATNTSINWTSSNELVAVVNANGKVTGVSPGSATIKATTINGGKVAQCTVQVSENPAKEPKAIALNKTSAQMRKDETMNLVATITPSNTKDNFITWESTNYDVVDVDNEGKVKAIDAGTARIIASTSNGIKTSCSITVSAPEKEMPKVEDITLDTTGTTLEKGETQKISVSFEPADAENQSIIWTSSDENVVTVNEDGVITTVGPGTATITATTEDGKISKTCVVEVPQNIAVTGIRLNKETATVIKGRSIEIEATVLPENATNSNIKVSISDEKIITMSSAGIKGVKAGTATITFTTEDGNFSKTCTIQVTEVPSNKVYVDSNTYDVSNENMEITQVGDDTTAKDFKDNVKTDTGTTITIKDKDGNPVADTENVGSGATVEVTNAGGTKETFTVVVNGDITGDGEINTTDLSVLKQYLMGNIGAGVYFNQQAADLNKDGEITLTDFTILKDMFMNGGNE